MSSVQWPLVLIMLRQLLLILSLLLRLCILFERGFIKAYIITQHDVKLMVVTHHRVSLVCVFTYVLVTYNLRDNYILFLYYLCISYLNNILIIYLLVPQFILIFICASFIKFLCQLCNIFFSN